MSILSVAPETEIATRNRLSCELRDSSSGDALTIANKHAPSSHGEAAKCNRDKILELEIARLEDESDSSYFDDMYKEITNG